MVKLTAFAPLLAGASSFTTGGAPLAPASLIAPQRTAVFASLADGHEPQDHSSKRIEFHSLQGGYIRDQTARAMFRKMIEDSNKLEANQEMIRKELEAKNFWLRQALERQAQAPSATKNDLEPENDLAGAIASTSDPKSTIQTSTESPTASTKGRRGMRLNWPLLFKHQPGTDARVIHTLSEKYGVNARIDRDEVDNVLAERRRARAAMNDFAGAVAADQEQDSGDINRWEDDAVGPRAIPDYYMKVQVGGAEVEMSYVDIGRMTVQEAQRFFCETGGSIKLCGEIRQAMEQWRAEQFIAVDEEVLELPLDDILSVPKQKEQEEETTGNDKGNQYRSHQGNEYWYPGGNQYGPEEGNQYGPEEGSQYKGPEEKTIDGPEEKTIDVPFTASYEYEKPAFVGIKNLAYLQANEKEALDSIYNFYKTGIYKDRPFYLVEMAGVEKWRTEARAEQTEHDFYNFKDF